MKQQSLFARQDANKQNSILALTPTLSLIQTVTLALTLILILPSNSKSKLQQTTNDNNLKNKRVFEQMSTHFFYLILHTQSSFAR